MVLFFVLETFNQDFEASVRREEVVFEVGVGHWRSCTSASHPRRDGAALVRESVCKIHKENTILLLDHSYKKSFTKRSL